MDIAITPITELIKSSIPLLKRQIDYIVHCKRKFNKLKEKVEELERARNDVRRRVDAARRNVESVHEVVEAWLVKVEKETTDRDGDDQTILGLVMNGEAVNMINTKCWCSCGSGSRYNLGRKAEKKMLILDELLNEGKSFGDSVSSTCVMDINPLHINNQDGSWKLFRKNVGGDNFAYSTGLETTGREIAKECGGLPIALVTLNKGLRFKQKHVWDSTLHKLRNSKTTCIEVMVPKVFSSIKLSYDFLGEIYKKYFLLCCLFPDDHEIFITNLMVYVVGDDTMFEDDEETLKQMTDTIKTVLDKLVDSCLLLKKKDIDDPRLYVVSMHDVIRDVAINIASHQEGYGFLVKAGVGLKDWPRRSLLSSIGTGKCLRRLSLMRNEITVLPNDQPPELPNLLSLSLSANYSLKEIPDIFFQRMGSLATLDLRQTGISLLPSSLSFLVNLKTLYLGGCKFNQSTDISVIGMLKKLEILSLTNCGLDGLPEEIRELTNLRLLNLEGNGTNNFTIPKNVISSMSCLEYLNTSHCNIKWEIEGLENGNNVALAEVSSRPCLSYLTLELYDHGNVNRFVITFSDEANIMCLNSRSSISPTKCSFNVSSVPVCHSIKVLIQRVESLELTECIGLKSLKSVGQLGAGFYNLKELKVKECSELEYVMSVAEADIEEARVSDVKFSRLREMSSCFENLEK